jgi:hypothetical protein
MTELPSELVESHLIQTRHFTELALERAVIEEAMTSGLAPG